ncbi:MAG: adenylate/guanylate cyclase domain-containing protein [Lachnospiraceae bacterium]|jgi:Adenylate cyclase, family 3 (some proteins contain HAMP domain)|nr:adenylate/guanylate cyclase domain-containing protein [Lachnospiraceae bacterium]
MGLTKSDFEHLDSRIKSITEQNVEQIEINSDLPPTVEQLEDNNKTYSIMAAILFIDIRKSTYLTENSQSKSMVKIYRSFMRMAVDCVRKNGGVTRQFLGDRIMGVFIDSVDEEGNISERAVDKAVNAARSLQTVIDFSLNKYLKSNVNGKVIECGIGIDYGKVLVTWVGMYGVESDENKEDEYNINGDRVTCYSK